MVQIVTVYPDADGGSRLADVSIDQFSEIIKHIGEGPNRLNQGPSPSESHYYTASRLQ
jgi:hypothetical protein